MTALVMMQTLTSRYFIIPALLQMTDDNKESIIAKFQRDKPFVWLRLLVQERCRSPWVAARL